MSTLVDDSLAAEIRKLVADLAAKDYELLASDGRIGDVAPDELDEAIARYGRTLIPLPDEAIALIDVYPLDADPSTASLDVPLWTAEEGHSDLMLFVTATRSASGYSVKIEDVRVP